MGRERKKEINFQRYNLGRGKCSIAFALVEGEISEGDAAKLRRSMSRNRLEERTTSSLKRTRNALQELFFINIVGAPPEGEKGPDPEYNLIAVLKEDGIAPIGIRVESRKRDIMKFYKEINPKFPEKSNQEELNERSLVVLNGQAPLLDIQESFLRQFISIQQYRTSSLSNLTL